MLEQLHELLAFILEKEVELPARKSRSFAGHFAELEEFFNLEAETLTALFRLVRYTTEVGTRQCRVPTAIEEQSGCTS